jgi:AcrR family transcriptional regulator
MPAVKRSAAPTASRRERSRATNRRIVKAAYTLFCERGYAGTTIAEIARAADVAVQTVYFTFHTKATLLSRAVDFAVFGEAEPLPPEEQPWFVEMVAQADLVAALGLFVSGAGEITRRVTPLEVVASGTAASDEEVAEVLARHERQRVEGYRGIIDLLVAKAPLRAGMSKERATHLLLLYVGMAVYHFLVETCGWSHETWADWTVETLAGQLFETAPATSQRKPGPAVGT